jgi:hypothetical protein
MGQGFSKRKARKSRVPLVVESKRATHLDGETKQTENREESHDSITKREQLASAAEKRQQQSIKRGATSSQGKLTGKLVRDMQSSATSEKRSSRDNDIVEMVTNPLIFHSTIIFESR